METTGTFLNNPDERDASLALHAASLASSSESVSSLSVLVNSLLMAFASCLGALPFFFVSSLSPKLIGIANSIACGVMLACSFDLIHDGEPHGPFYLILGILTGVLVISWTQHHLQKYEELKFDCLQGADARKILLVLGIMAAHAAGEGAGVGVSYSGDRGRTQGLVVTCAIGLHNIPEGLAVATILISRGVPIQRAIWWNAFVALPQALFAFPSFLFVETFKMCLPFALGLAAGCMIWVVFSEILPDALENIPPPQAATIISLSAIGLESFRMLLEFLEKSPESHLSMIRTLIILICPILIALVVKAKVKCLSLSVGIGVGMNFVCGISLLLKQLFQSPRSIPASILWSIIGGLISFLISRNIIKKPQKGVKSDSGLRLPMTSGGQGVKSMAPFSFLSQDVFFVLGGCCLIGLGVIGGERFPDFVNSSKPLIESLVPLLIKGSFYGIMIGLWSLRIPMSKVWVQIAMLGLVPAGGSWLMLLGRVKAMIGGFIITASLQLMCTKAAFYSKLKTSHREGSELESVPEMSPTVGFQSMIETEVWTTHPHFYQSIGILIGSSLTIAYFVFLAVLCKWTPLYCP